MSLFHAQPLIKRQLNWSIYRADLLINDPITNQTIVTLPLQDFRIHSRNSLLQETESQTNHLLDHTVTTYLWYRLEYVIAVAHYIADTTERTTGERPQIYGDVGFCVRFELLTKVDNR